MIVYMDLFFLDNLVMNFIILWLTNKLSKNRAHIWRLILSATVGALYALGSFVPSLYYLDDLLAKIVLSIIMVLLGFQVQHWSDFLRLIAIFYMVTFLFGGAAFGILYFFNQGFMLDNGGFYFSGYPIVTMAEAVFIAYIVLNYCWSYIRMRLEKRDLVMSIEIALNNKAIKTNALLDTGNTLHDPISNFPVVIMELSCLRDILPQSIAALFDVGAENDMALLVEALSGSPWMARFRMIPFSSLGRSNGLLLGFRPDYIKVFSGGHIIETSDIIVGIYNNKLSQNGNYSALLHPGLMA